MPNDVDQYGTPVSGRPRRGYASVNTTKSKQYGLLVSGKYSEVATVISTMAAGDYGSLRQQLMMFLRMIEIDARLSAVYQTRLEALLQAEYAIMPSQSDDSQEPVDFMVEQMRKINPISLMSQMHSSVMLGVSLHEIVYANDWSLDKVTKVPEWYLDWSGDSLQILQGGKTIKLENDKYIRSIPSTHPGPLWRQGLMRTLAVYWTLKHAAIQDFAAFNEVFGMPLRVGRYPLDSDETHKAALKTGVEELGTDASAIIPNTMDIEFIEPKSQTTSASNNTPIERMIAFVDRAMTIRVLGSHLATESESGSGTLAGNAQERPTDWIVRGDARRISESIQGDLFRPLVKYNLGEGAPVPRLAWPGLEDSVDQQSRGAVFVLAQGLGIDLSVSQVRSELQLNEPDGEDDVIQSAAEPEATLGIAELAASRLPLGSPHRAIEKAVLASSSDVEREITRIDELVAKRIESVLEDASDLDHEQQIEAVMTRLRLDAGDIDQLLSDAGIDRGEIEGAISGMLLAAAVDGRQSVRDESEA